MKHTRVLFEGSSSVVLPKVHIYKLYVYSTNDLRYIKVIQIQTIATIIARNDNFDMRIDEIIPCVTPLHEEIRALFFSFKIGIIGTLLMLS